MWLTEGGQVSQKVVMAFAGLTLVVASNAALADTQAYGVPFVPRASNTVQQGFVRLVNLSESAGDARITAIDDTGRRFPEIRIALDALATVHFNSEDLEQGNERKGLSRGVGAGAGDWRLEVEADFAFEALAYIRTSDGFVTSVFEAADWWDVGTYWVPFFNPGSNRAQVSKLRLVNPTGQRAQVGVVGFDDRGEIAPGGRVELTLDARASRTITASELEDGTDGLSGRLGDGTGKWRLWVVSDRRLHVLSLLESPTGSLTNLSTASAWGRRDVPLVLPSSSDQRESFVRVVNHSRRAGDVRIEVLDDEGRRYGRASLALGSFEAAHFNSSDLANGNAGKGLSGGIGAFAGDLRLELETDLVITPLVYVRTTDGFVTSVHDLGVQAEELTWLPIVNPGSNAAQQSRLRLINPADTDVTVEIVGRDDQGDFGAAVEVSLPPQSARTLTSRELEDGGARIRGRLGDGAGKWSFLLSADEPIRAMSLLNSPTGNLTNLSATALTQRLRITDAPVAHDLSLSTDLRTPYIEVPLNATDPNGDMVWFVVDRSRNGEGYQDAYVDVDGTLLATLVPDGRSSLRIPFRATDGDEWSDRAFVTVTIDELRDDDRGLGAEDVDPEDFARLPTAYFDPEILSDYEDGTRSLPRAIDLSGNFPAVGSQGNQNSCVGWAVSYLKSYQERVEERWEFGRDTQFSPAWIYNQINRGRDQGSNPLDAMQLVHDSGAATLATMPYDAYDYLRQPSAAAFEEAANFLGGEIKTLRTVQEYKAALAHRVPFVLGMPVYESFHRLSGRNAVYTDLSGVSQGGHAVVVVGFDDERFGGAFRVLNSWGPGWGDRGFFWLPYDTFRDARFDPARFALTIEDRVNGDVAPRDPPSRTSACRAGEALPNLTVASWEVEYRATAGGAGRWMWRVTNTGTATAPAGVDVNLLLSPDPNINASDHWLIYEEIPFELAPGRAAYRDADNAKNFTIPESISPGLYYMAMWVDDVAEVRECDETDNLLIGRDLVELQSGKPDLVPTSWYAEWDGYGNGELEFRVENGGTAATTRTGWWIALVLHTEAELSRGYV